MSELPEDWVETTLREVAEIIMGQSPKGETCNVTRKGIPLLNGPTEFGDRSPSAVQYTIDARKKSKNEDLLFCVRGSITGRMNWADKEYAIGRGIAAIRHGNGTKYKHFIKAVFDYKLPVLLSSATGSTFPNVSKSQLEELVISLPPHLEQKAIAAVLSVFDDKIDLLREQNETLETLAQTIFKQWFVHFNFPDQNGKPYRDYGGEMVDSELGEIPMGWRVGKLGEEFDITMGQSPKGETYNEIGDGMVFYQGRAEFQERFPKRRLYTTDPKRIAKPFDVLMSVRAPVGDINVASEKCCIGRGLSAVSSQYKSYALYKMNSIAREFKHFESAGTVFGSINKSDFENISVLIPNQETIELYDSIVSVMDKKIFNNISQIQTLSRTRDTLLPKLMSGEIRVKI